MIIWWRFHMFFVFCRDEIFLWDFSFLLHILFFYKSIVIFEDDLAERDVNSCSGGSRVRSGAQVGGVEGSHSYEISLWDHILFSAEFSYKFRVRDCLLCWRCEMPLWNFSPHFSDEIFWWGILMKSHAFWLLWDVLVGGDFMLFAAQFSCEISWWDIMLVRAVMRILCVYPDELCVWDIMLVWPWCDVLMV